MAGPTHADRRSRPRARKVLVAIAITTTGLVLGVVVLSAAAASMLSGISVGSPPSAAGAGSVLSGAGAIQIPAVMAGLYHQAAAAGCRGLSWTVLAAIGTVESDNGTSTLPGVHAGANAAGAEGPMQFEPATFAAYDEPVPPGGADPPSPYDATDAVYAADRMLCADGAGHPTTLARAIWDYNHSTAYVATVLSLATSLAQEISSPRTVR